MPTRHRPNCRRQSAALSGIGGSGLYEQPRLHAEDLAELARLGGAAGSLPVEGFVHVTTRAEDRREQFRGGLAGVLDEELACLYRAVDPTGETIEFYVVAKRDLIAAKLFLRLALTGGGRPPRVINVDGHPAYSIAIRRAEAVRRTRPALSLSNIALHEQHHRARSSIQEADHGQPRIPFGGGWVSGGWTKRT